MNESVQYQSMDPVCLIGCPILFTKVYVNTLNYGQNT